MLYLNEFRDDEINYPTAMVEAAKKANSEIRRLRDLIENRNHTTDRREGVWSYNPLIYLHKDIYPIGYK